MKITDILKNKNFTVSVEIVPPKNGADLKEVLKNIESIKKRVDFISVTKGAGGSLRGGTLPITYYSQKELGINTISHFVCRERTKQEIENDLVDMNCFGIDNILALRGDPPAGSMEPWSGDYKYAYMLTGQIKNMNKGIYLPKKTTEKESHGIKSNFCICVAGHPEDPIEEEIAHIKEKIKHGAEVIITQMIFSFEEYKDYVEMLKRNGIFIPIIPGIRPLRNISLAESIEQFFGLKVNEELKNGLKEEGESFGLAYFKKLIKKLKDYKAPGVHFFILNDFEIIKELVSD